MEETGFIGGNMDNVLRTINSSMPKADEEVFSKIKDDNARAEFMLQRDLIHDSLVFHASYEKKSSTKSRDMREEGNRLFKKREYRESVKTYSNSILLAPTDQTLPESLCSDGENEEINPKEQLPLAFANRSAAFLHLKKFELCIKDIDNAVKTGYPASMMYKLHDRKGKCYFGLKQFEDAKEEFTKGLECLTDAKLDEKMLENWKVSFEKDIKGCGKGISVPMKERKLYKSPSINEQNKNYPLLKNSVTVCYDEKLGKHLKASTSISPGELILAESPYASILLYDYYDNHCYHCLYRIEGGIPDHQNGNIQFCSEQCRDLAWAGYHKTEYKYMNLLAKDWCGTIGHLVYRIITKVGFSNLMTILQQNAGEIDEEKKVLEGDEIYDTGIASIFKMATNIKQRVAEGLSDFTVFAVYLTKLLHLSNFFDASPEKIEPNTKCNESLIKVCGTIMTLLQIVQINARGVIELMHPTDFENPKPIDIGMAIHTTAALVNHSCNPTAVAVFHGNNIEILSIANITKGKEVTIDYGMIFYKNVLPQRRMNLSLKYSFQCKCEACVNNWPLWRDLLTDYPIWKCENCEYELNIIRTMGGDLVRCDRCNHSQDLDERLKKLMPSHDLFNKSMETALVGDTETALAGFISHLSLCQKYLLPPWRDLVVAQAAVRQSLRLRGNVRII